MSKYDIPIGSVIINMDGKNIGTFANHIPRRTHGAFWFADKVINVVFTWTGFQVWQGDVDERDLVQYPQWFDVKHGDVYRKQHGLRNSVRPKHSY